MKLLTQCRNGIYLGYRHSGQIDKLIIKANTHYIIAIGEF